MAGSIGIRSAFGTLSGGTLGQVLVRVGIDTKQLEAGLAKAKAETSSVGNSVSKFGGLATTAYLVAGAAALKFGVDAVKAASAQAESINKVGEVFGKTSGQIEAFADTAAESLGIAKTAALDAAANFGLLFQAAGNTTDAAAAMSEKMVALASDLASFFDASPEEALSKLRGGFAGAVRPLREYGVFISAARVNTEAYSSGIAKVGSELTDAQKIQARYNIILEDTTKAQGDFSRTSDSLANSVRTLRAEWEDFKAEVGESLTEPAAKGVSFLTGAVKDLGVAADETTSFLDTAGSAWGEWAKLFGGGTLSVSTVQYIGTLGELRRATRETTQEVVTGIDKLSKSEKEWSADTVKALTLQMTSLSGVKRAWDLTANAAVRATTIIADKQGAIAKDLQALDKLKIGEGLKKQIAALGPDMVHAFISGNKNQRQQILENLKDYNEAVKQTTKETKQLALVGGQQVGIAMGDGLIKGITLRSPDIDDAARQAVAEAIQAARDAAGAQSPSTVMAALGKDLMSGLALGIDAGAKQVQGALERVVDGLRSGLSDLINKRKSFAGGIAGGFSGFGITDAISGLFGQTDASGTAVAVGSGDISGAISSQLAQAQQFARLLRRGAKAGLGKNLLGSFASQGAGAIPGLQAILGDPALLAQAKAASQEIAKLTSATAERLGDKYFGKSIDAARDKLDKFAEALHRVTQAMNQSEGLSGTAFEQAVANAVYQAQRRRRSA